MSEKNRPNPRPQQPPTPRPQQPEKIPLKESPETNRRDHDHVEPPQPWPRK